MAYAMLDDEELLRLALEAMNADKDAESMDLLKALVDRGPTNGHGQYLLAAQYAQVGMMDRAEAGFRAAVDAGLQIPAARFQLGQLLLLKGENAEARQVLEPLQGQGDAFAAYAEALAVLATGDVAAAVGLLRTGLDRHQQIPVLAEDMRRLMTELQLLLDEPAAPAEGAVPAAASLLLSGYHRQH